MKPSQFWKECLIWAGRSPLRQQETEADLHRLDKKAREETCFKAKQQSLAGFDIKTDSLTDIEHALHNKFID